MTNFQDPQPQSRRAARRGERSGAAEAEVGGFPPPARESTNDDMWDTTSRRAAQLPPVAPAAPVESVAPASPTSGRRSAAPAQEPVQPPVSAPLASAPQPAPEQARERVTTSAPLDDNLAPTQALPAMDKPQYRVRDYSPEASRVEPPVQESPADWAATFTPEPAPTYQAPAAQVAPAAVSPAAEVPSAEPQVEQVPAERTMTRRELRALQQQAPTAEEEPPALQEPEVAQPAASPGAVTGILNSLGFVDTDALPIAVPDSNEESALALEEQAPAAAESAWPFAATPAVAPVFPEPSFPEPVFPEPVAARAEEPQAEAWEAAVPEPVAATSIFPAVAPEPLAATALDDALAEFDRLAGPSDEVEPQDAAPQVFPEALAPPAPSTVPAPQPYAEEPFPTPVPFIPAPVAAEEPVAPLVIEESPSSEITWTPPRGHWSSQLDHEDEFIETTVNRSVGSGATTTSALVLPSIPEANISGPLDGSGEIMLTGSIELPQTFSAAGAGSSARLEHAGIDRLFEAHDAEVVSTESSPVSAINAVSTRSGSGLSQAPKQQGTKALTALIIAAASMGVLVIGLLITALALNVF